jgi:uncharacterized protein YecE (DUF72 family)
MSFPENLLVGTSSWSSTDWVGPFYPPNLKPGQFIEAYARKFRAVEIDSTYYSIPSPQVVTSWREKTPPGFIFAAKIPGVITHEKVLKDCQAELTMFLKNMELLGNRLGPLLLQFPYFNRNVFPSREPFERRLKTFLETLPKDFKFALEIAIRTGSAGIFWSCCASTRSPSRWSPRRGCRASTRWRRRWI